MPFGLKNAIPTFQRLMELVLSGMDWEHCMVYLDDICLFSPKFEHYIDLLERVFLKLCLANLKLKASKCQLFCDKVVYLGDMVSGEGIQPDPGSIEKVKQWRNPPSVAELRSFLGLSSYYRKILLGVFADIASELYKLTEKCSRLNWNDEVHACAFENLKAVLTSPPLLAYPDFEKPFILQCDASDNAVGVILAQISNGKEHVVSYGSKALEKKQKQWIPYD